MAEDSALLQRAWELCYLDPLAARDVGRQLVAAGGVEAASGWLHVGLAEIRVGSTDAGSAALQQARLGFDAHPHASERDLGLALCDEVSAIQLRTEGQLDASAKLQARIDAVGVPMPNAIHRFIAHNSRAITAKVQGRTDDALRHFYAASDAAEQSGWTGPRITALSNLGGYHQDLYNLEDARTISEKALLAARDAHAPQIVTNSGVNLIVIYYATGEPQRARAMLEFLLTHPQEQVPGALLRQGSNLALGHLGVGEIDAALAYLKPGAQRGVANSDGVANWAWITARCLLAKGNAQSAHDTVQEVLQQRARDQVSDLPYDVMELHRVLADACEQLGDSAGALRCLRKAHQLYEQLVGRSARARFIALEVKHQLGQAQMERDMAVDSRRSADNDRSRLADLNQALRTKISETEMLHAKLSEQALRDPLTGLHNRRYLFEMAPGLLELARRQGHPLCVVLIDLDHFKLLNDTFGHHAGDAVLQRFAGLLSEMLRRSDVVNRHGGEEFVAVMPDLDASGAHGVLSRLLKAYQAQQQEVGRRRLPQCSFSAGIASFPLHGNTLEQLLSRADRALYTAKNLGRARIEQAPGTDFGTLA